jgi:rubrerythrin
VTTEEWPHAVTENLKELYEEESWEVGSRLARAAKAREDGYPELAALMEEIAPDEARHQSLVVRCLYPDEVERDVRTNLEAMLEQDRGAAEREQRLAAIARQAGMEREASLFEALARDELEHAARLEAALKHVNPRAEGEGGG